MKMKIDRARTFWGASGCFKKDRWPMQRRESVLLGVIIGISVLTVSLSPDAAPTEMPEQWVARAVSV
jgi:hypothetical protein